MKYTRANKSIVSALQVALLGLALCATVQAQSPGAQDGSVLWTNRQSFLAATQAGEMAKFHSAPQAERDKVVASIQRILMTEYRVPPISSDCFKMGGFYGDVVALMGDIAESNVITLDDKGPDFTNATANRAFFIDSVDRRLTRMQSARDRTHCDGESMGRVVPHPYKAALVSLTADYAKATQAYVEAERNRRQVAYREEVARNKAEEQQRLDSTRAIEQQRIDAEADRIRADEQRRAQKQKVRIGG